MYLIFFFCLLEFSGGIQVTPVPESWTGYHDYHQMTEFLVNLVNNHTDIASFYSIGNSVEQRELWVLKIRGTETPIIGTPHIKFVGNIHGNEPVGRELILYFAEYLLKNYKTDSEVKRILDRTTIHLLPSLNPDGFARSKEGECYKGPGRENGNLVDLNRSFPDHFKENSIPIQPETLAVAQWMSKVPFILSASFHGGALVANYPFDSNPISDVEDLMEELRKNISEGANLLDLWRNLTPNGSNRVNIICTEVGFGRETARGNPRTKRDLLSPHYSLTPDDDVFRHLAQTYSDNHLTMHKGRTCNENQPSFPGGITNGAAWYSFTGGMQDFNYVSRGCMELTLEISCCKYPLSNHLPRLWAENKRAMLELAKQSQIGVKGVIMDKITSAYIPGAVLLISGRNVPFTSSKNGEFWRILLPGDYHLIVQAKGYEPQSFPFTVDGGDGLEPNATWLNIYLQPIDDMVAEESSNIIHMVENSGTFPSFSSLPFLCLVAFFTIKLFS